MELKPIETIYNGYRFRSRLEARWAVFFDEAHIKYQYETEGFNLNGEYYLPDFYLPDFNIYVEIKPLDNKTVNHIGDGNIWEQKCKKFQEITNNAILLCYGDPAETTVKLLYSVDYSDSSGGPSVMESTFFESDRGICILCCDSRDRVFFGNGPLDNVYTLNNISASFVLYEAFYAQLFNDIDGKLKDAKFKARQARFEYGEMPA